MGSHINADGEFQSDKFPTCPAGKVPLSTKDPTAQDLLWEYAQRRRDVDEEFSDDLEKALKEKGYLPEEETSMQCIARTVGVEDADCFGAILNRVEALHRAVLGSHRVVVDPNGGADTCGDCGVDIEDALTDGIVCQEYRKSLAPEPEVQRLSDAVSRLEREHPLPRCPHGRSLRDHAGDVLTCPEGCTLEAAKL